jgi:hypothetical protein
MSVLRRTKRRAASEQRAAALVHDAGRLRDSLRREQQWPYPYLLDESQDVAQALGAGVTPRVFVLDSEQWLADRGAPDADHQDPSHNVAWLRSALVAVLAGKSVAEPETRARGGSVKGRV